MSKTVLSLLVGLVVVVSVSALVDIPVDETPGVMKHAPPPADGLQKSKAQSAEGGNASDTEDEDEEFEGYMTGGEEEIPLPSDEEIPESTGWTTVSATVTVGTAHRIPDTPADEEGSSTRSTRNPDEVITVHKPMPTPF